MEKERKEKDTLEKRVVDAILERSSDEIEIDGERLQIAPPTVATLMLVSEAVAELPMVDKGVDNALIEVLATAKDMAVVGRIAAILMLGAKRVNEKRERIVGRKRQWSWRRCRIVTTEEREAEVEWLGRRVLEEVSPGVLLKVVSRRLVMMEVADFFALTTSLSEANQLRRTREVETRYGEKS